MEENRTGRYQKAAGILLLAVLLLAGCRRRADTELVLKELVQEEESIQTTAIENTEQTDTEQHQVDEAVEEPLFYYVHICGQVQYPGVYKLEAGSRIYEAAAMAGGFTEIAAQSYVNQAGLVEDGMKIVIPSIQEAEAGWDITDDGAGLYREETADQQQEMKVNLNTASTAQLCTLPGIGESRAKSIIAYREANGGFQTTEEIMSVEGIKEGAYAKIKDKISVK